MIPSTQPALKIFFFKFPINVRIYLKEKAAVYLFNDILQNFGYVTLWRIRIFKILRLMLQSVLHDAHCSASDNWPSSKGVFEAKIKTRPGVDNGKPKPYKLRNCSTMSFHVHKGACVFAHSCTEFAFHGYCKFYDGPTSVISAPSFLAFSLFLFKLLKLNSQTVGFKDLLSIWTFHKPLLSSTDKLAHISKCLHSCICIMHLFTRKQKY